MFCFVRRASRRFYVVWLLRRAVSSGHCVAFVACRPLPAPRGGAFSIEWLSVLRVSGPESVGLTCKTDEHPKILQNQIWAHVQQTLS